MGLQNLLLALGLSLVVAGCSKGNSNGNSNDGGSEYIVVLKKPQVQLAAAQANVSPQSAEFVSMQLQSVSKDSGVEGVQKKVYSAALAGGLYELTAEQAEKLRQNPSVAYVEKNGIVRMNDTQTDPTWGLDRVDQKSLPLNRAYNYGSNAAQVNAYVIDTGILTSHSDFRGRAVHGYDAVDNDDDATDCQGHGTHVAGTIGGEKYGVAKGVKLHAVRVLNCSGSGAFSDVIEGIEWVTRNHVKPAVANMSLGGSASQSIDDAIKGSVQAGVTYVVAAGNDGRDACNYSPARTPEAITVGSTTNKDKRSSFSNHGTCVDIFAPGSDIESAWSDSNTSTKTISGTSMASPHVAGVAALYLAAKPSATPAQVSQALTSNGANGKLQDVKTGSPNILVNTEFLSGTDPVDPDPVDPDPVDPDPVAPCTNCTEYTGSLRGSGDYQYQPNGNYYYSSTGKNNFHLQSPAGADFDLYLYQYNGYQWVLVAVGNTGGAKEQVKYQGRSGYYVVVVYSKSGAGSYKLWMEK